MHLVLDARAATDHFPGIGRYVVNLACAMASLPGRDEQLILLRDPTQPSRWDLTAWAGERMQLVDVPLSPFSQRQQWVLPRLLRRLGADVYHSPYYLMPYWPGIPALVTIHDLIPLHYPGYFTPVQRLIFATTIRLAVRAARRVIAVSQATAADLQQSLRLPRERIAVIPEAAAPSFRPQPPSAVAAVRSRLNLPEQYVLYLGSNKPHKNLPRLVEAWAHITHHASRITLVIAGHEDPRYPQARQRAAALGLDNVLFLGAVAEEDLPALYSGAELFVFPSLYEGFGLPVIEAMACGTPVACSNTSSLPEVAGDAALLFDPHTPEAMATAIHQALRDEELREELRRRGLAQAQRFSWEQTARMTYAVYKEVLSTP